MSPNHKPCHAATDGHGKGCPETFPPVQRNFNGTGRSGTFLAKSRGDFLAMRVMVHDAPAKPLGSHKEIDGRAHPCHDNIPSSIGNANVPCVHHPNGIARNRNPSTNPRSRCGTPPLRPPSCTPSMQGQASQPSRFNRPQKPRNILVVARRRDGRRWIGGKGKEKWRTRWEPGLLAASQRGLI
jgi:hypothetical protein